MSSRCARCPSAANAASAAASTFSRLRTASARGRRSGESVVTGVTTPIIVMSTPIPSTPRSPMTASVAGTGTEHLYARRWWALSVLCLSLLIVFVGNSSPERRHPHPLARSARDRVAAAVGRRDLLARVRGPALHDRRARRPVRPQGRAAGRAGCSSRSARSSRRRPTAWRRLIACRALMGVAAALIMPSTLSIIINIFPAHERPKAIAIWASVTGAAGALRPGRQRLPARPLLVRRRSS